MADVREMRVFSTEQIQVPPELPTVLKDFAKEVITNNPQNVIQFARQYFEKMMKDQSSGPTSASKVTSAEKNHHDEEEE